MKSFRILLVLVIVSLFVYTCIVSINNGWNLFQIFFGDIARMTWPGQFNFDFSCFLILSGLWLAWRNNFTPKGIIIGLVGIVGGMLFLATYLLFASYKANGSFKELFLGKREML